MEAKLKNKKRFIKKRRCVVAWVMTIVLPFQMCLPYMGVMATEHEAQVINVTDYGADPSGKNDSVPAIQKAIEAAKQVEGAVILNFPKGNYSLYPDYAVQKKIWISNATTSDANALRTIGVYIENMDNLTIEGNGSNLMYHGEMMCFVLMNCKNACVQNLSWDFATHTSIDLTVEATTESTADVYVPEGYDYSIDGTILTFYGDKSPYTGTEYWSRSNATAFTRKHVYNMMTDSILTEDGTYCDELFANCTSIEDIGNRRLRFHYSDTPQSTPGMNIQLRERVRQNPGMSIYECEDVTIQDVDIHFMNVMGIVGQCSKNITITRVNICSDDTTGTMSASGADGIHMSGCGGKIEISECHFRNTQDDNINIHGTFLRGNSVLASNQIQLKFSHNETYGFENYHVGDEIEFISRDTLNPVGTDSKAIVTAVEMNLSESATKAQRQLCTLTLDRDIPEEIQTGDPTAYVVENVTYTPEVHIHDCYFESSMVRNLLVTTRKPVLIENNIFKDGRFACIFVEDDSTNWYESGALNDITIRNNVFEKSTVQTSNWAVLRINPACVQEDKDNPVHKNITIEGNTFRIGADVDAFELTSVENVKILNNTFELCENPISVNVNVAQDTLKSDSVTTATTDVDIELHSKYLYRFTYSKDITISGNTYGVGLNKYVSTAAMDTSEVTIKDEEILLNQTNQPTDYFDGAKTQYYSTDSDVAMVDAQTGTIYANKAGSAGIYAVVTTKDGKQWESARKVIRVEEETGTVQDIEVKADSDRITEAGKTVTLTAEIDGTTQSTVTWSVTDAVTGNVTEAATINANGVLTAVESGAVEVTAKTADGNTGSKIIFISIAKPELTGDLTYQNDAENRVVPNSDGSVSYAVQEMKTGGFWKTRTYGENLIEYSLASAENVDVTIRITGAVKSANSYEEAGMVILKDWDNYAGISRKKHLASNAVVINEISQTATETLTSTSGAPMADGYYRVVKTGTSVTGYYRTTDTEAWTEVTTVTNTALGNENLKLVIYATGADNEANTIKFSELTINGESQPLAYNNQMPVVKNAKITSDELSVGKYAKVEYDYSDADGDSKGNTVVLWYMADSADGTWSRIEGVVSNKIWLLPKYAGKYLKAEIVPVDEKGLLGESVAAVTTKAVAAGDLDSEATDSRKSSNAWLSDMELEGVSMSADFSYNVLRYVAGVTAKKEKVILKATAQVAGANVSVTLNGETITGADGSWNLVLASGINRIAVLVTAPDGVTAQKYQIFVIRNGYDVTTVDTLTINGVEIEGFDPEITEYEIWVEEPAELTVGATKTNSRAKMLIADGHQTTESTSLTSETALGNNVFVIAVTSEEGGMATYYQIDYHVCDATNANLQTAVLGGVELDGVFAPETLSYSGTAIVNTVNLSLKAEEQESSIKVYVNQQTFTSERGELTVNVPVYLGINQMTVVVTSPDSSVRKCYTFTYEGKESLYLSDLAWVSATSGWSTVKRDATVANSKISVWLGGQKVYFTKGLGANATSTIIYDVKDKGYVGLEGYAGIDTTRSGTAALATFQIFADGVEVFNSGELDGADNAGRIDLDIRGVEILTLVADMGAQTNHDHCNWADIKFITDLPEKEATTGGDTAVVLPYVAVDNTGDLPVPLVTQYQKYLFAGWYTDADCTVENAITDPKAINDTSYARFIPAEILDVKAQVSTAKISAGTYKDNWALRFISSVESLLYKNAGFKVTYKDAAGTTQTKTVKNNTVYEKIASTEKEMAYTFNPRIIAIGSEYFITAKLPVADTSEAKATDYTVQAFVETFDGTLVYGSSRTLCVEDAGNNTLNMVLDANTELKGNDYTATYGLKGTETEATKVMVLSSDADGHSNVRITIPGNVSEFKSATKVIIYDANGNQVASEIYRNYYTSHDKGDGTNSANADTSWYDVNPNADEFVLASSADLYGFSSLVNAGTTFEGKTVTLVRDVEINKGEVVKSSGSTAAKWKDDDDIVYDWMPIGRDSNFPFQGTFDGGGSTVRGLNRTNNASNADPEGKGYVGFFGMVGHKGIVKNLAIKNSYFENYSNYTGGVIGFSRATYMGNLYSDAVIVNTTGICIGGIVGRLGDHDDSSDMAVQRWFDGCWYDGQINISGAGSWIGGIVGQTFRVVNVKMTDCLFTGEMNLNGNVTAQVVGGMYGGNNVYVDMTMQNCVVTGNITSNGKATSGVGSLAGTVKGTALSKFENCYATSGGPLNKAFGTISGTAFTPVSTDYIVSEDTLKVSTEAELLAKLPLLSGQRESAWKCNTDEDVNVLGTPILKEFLNMK